MVATIGVIVLQLIPLPPAIWTTLPGREAIANGYQLLGIPAPWLPITLSPHSTLSSAFHLLPPFAIILVMLRIGYDGRWIAWVVAVVASGSVFLGILQLAGNETRQWRAYQLTSDAMTGLFANSNHLATLLVVTIPFTASMLFSRRSRSGRRLISLAAISVLAIVATGLVLNPSLAGLLLLVPVSAATFLVLTGKAERRSKWRRPTIALAMLGACATLVAIGSSDTTATNAKSSALPRYDAFTNTLAATLDFMPVGSGFGTFVKIYERYQPDWQVSVEYMNHAHNDYLEAALEGGLPSVVLMLCFLIWWIREAFALKRRESVPQVALAGLIASGAILLHSLVDYPLRTAALATLFAACCVLLSREGIPEGQASGRS
jgi:O-antigen ligase